MTSISSSAYRPLEVLDKQSLDNNIFFCTPQKEINDGADLSTWSSSRAYRDITKFLLQLNVSMFPQRDTADPSKIEHWTFESESEVGFTTNVSLSPSIKNLQNLIGVLTDIVTETPPDTSPRRFGNISFRKWSHVVEERVDELMKKFIPQLATFDNQHQEGITALQEVKTYLLGSFGSSQRLDYGTGHELSFVAFLGCLWKLGVFRRASPGVVEREIVLGVIEPYLRLIRLLILTYTLEPAGSHGVWGLDDHSFVPYIFGSAQLSPALSGFDNVPIEGSDDSAPAPGDVTQKPIIKHERTRNMYFSAIGFINDVKKGPFWEHSPILFDVSGVTAGWAKINKGMIKMYNVEVLSKFPVVQHFPFGSLFSWSRDPDAVPIASSTHTKVQPQSTSDRVAATVQQPSRVATSTTRAPWASNSSASSVLQSSLPPVPARFSEPLGGMPPPGPTGLPMTRAPWATSQSRAPPLRSVNTASGLLSRMSRAPPGAQTAFEGDAIEDDVPPPPSGIS